MRSTSESEGKFRESCEAGELRSQQARQRVRRMLVKVVASPVVPPCRPGIGVTGGVLHIPGQAGGRATATSTSYDHSSLWTAMGG